MNDCWDEYALNWDKNEDVLLYSQKAYQSLVEILDINNLKILDFGCGTGLLSEKMSPLAKEIVAIDTSEKMISVLENKNLNNIKSLNINLSEETIKTNEDLHATFDLIVASSVCAFLPNYQHTLTLLKKIMVKNGIFIQWDWFKDYNESGFGLNKNQIKSAFTQSGFQTISISDSFTMSTKSNVMKVIMGVAKNA